ncbi:MAG: retention module-containing protein, partial [Neptuniibacter sp.]
MDTIGTVSLLIGRAIAVKADGSERVLALGDQVFADEMIRVSPDGAIEIAMDAGDSVKLEGGQTWLASSETYQTTEELDLSEAVADVDSIQAAILAGADPTQVAEATAAGGETAAGGDGNEGSSTVNVERTAEEVDPNAGYDTIGFQTSFEQPEEELLFTPEEPEPEPPVVSVSVQVEVEVEVETEIDPTDPEVEDPFEETGETVLLSPEGVLVLEGTETGENTDTRDVTFNLVLDKVFDQDVEVTYTLRPVSNDGTADNPTDWFNGPENTTTVTIPAGSQSIPVTVTIVQDHLDEGNGQFEIVLLDAVNAEINPDADSEQIFIIDDDTTPTAFDDVNSVTEDDVQGDGFPTTTGNVVGGTGVSSGDVADVDEDGDIPQVTTFSFGGTTVSAGQTLQGNYGELTINADGSYTYTLTSNDDPVIQGLSEGDEPLVETFTYVINDTYNLDPEDESEATLTININGADDGVTITGLTSEGAEEFVSEANLSDGSSPDAGSLTQDGSFSFEAKDGLDTVSIGGQSFDLAALNTLDGTQTVAMSYGTLKLTGYVGNEFGGTISYEYTLDDNVDNDSQAGADDFGFTDSVSVVVTDEDGSSDSESLDVYIADDSPIAENDGLLATVDDGAAGVDVGDVSDLLGNDFYGADGGTSISISAGSLGGSVTVSGTDLLYTSATDVDPEGEQPVTETFTYTITDEDGDTKQATFTVDLVDGRATIGDPTDSSVDEEGLSGNAGDSYLDSGDLAGEAVSVSAQDLDITWGADGAGSVTFDDTQSGLSGITSGGENVNFVLLSNDTLLVGYTGDTAPTADNYTTDGSVVYYASLSSAGTGSYDFTLVQPLDHDTANTEDDEALTFAFTALDAEDEGSSSTFTVTVDDDAPVAIDDGLLDTVDDNAEDVVIGTLSDLLGDDSYGADGAASSGSITIAAGDLGGTVTINGSNLEYTSATDVDPDGSQPVEETFVYTIKDADGDTQTATFTVNLTDEKATIGDPTDSSVDEEGLSGNAGDSYLDS